MTASASRLGGGMFEAVARQAEMIRLAGGEAHVFALEDRFSAEDRHRFEPSPVTLCRRVGPALIGYAPGLVPALIAADLDVLHLRGIWVYTSRAGLVWARRTKRPYFVTLAGMLDRWITGRGRWKKALARLGYERANWRAATALHALSAKEAADVARESGRDDVLVIPNAAPAPVPAAAGPRPPHIVFIGRIHAKKNVHALLAAWREARLPEGAHLTIAGWGSPEDVAAVEADAAVTPAAEFIGAVFGDAKRRLLQDARFMILPSHSEGLPLAVLESWAAGTPTVMTAECNLPEGFAAGAAIECGYDPPAIAAAVEQGLALDDGQWQAMSDAARGLAGGRFSLTTLSAEWAGVYSRALGRD